MQAPSRGLPAGTLTELLDSDCRPTFVVNLPATSTTESLPIAYHNPALAEDAPLYEEVRNITKTQDAAFWDWITGATSASTNRALRPRTFTYKGACWTTSVVAQRWAVVGCNEQRGDSENIARPPPFDRNRSNSIFQTAPSIAVKDSMSATDDDWTVPDLLSEQEPYVHIINSFDWASTPLGPMDRWSSHLQQTFSQILADSQPISIYWGPDLTMLYNEAFGKLCGATHLELLGKSVDEAWPNFGDDIKHTMKACSSGQRASVEKEWCFFVKNADGSLVETYLKWYIVPVIVNDECLGFLQPVIDDTSMRLWERRMKMLVDLSNALVTARDTKSYWRKALLALEECKPITDVPLAIVYSLSDGPESSGGTPKKPSKYNKICHLEGSLGIPEGHPLVPETLSLKTGSEGLTVAFRQALKLQTPIFLQTKDGTLPEALLEGLKSRGSNDLCNSCVVCPIRPTTGEHVMGIVVLGINTRRPYDHDYQQYISLLSQKLTTTLASTVLFEEEARRNRNAAEQAAYDEAKLKEKLAVQTKEATENMSKFQAVAEFIPVGMCFGDRYGNITFANDLWYRIMGIKRRDHIATTKQDVFYSRVVDDDKQNVDRAYGEMQMTGSAVIEFRVHNDDATPLQHPIGSSPSFEKAGLDLTTDNPKERHVLASLKAECAPDGSILRVMACATDVTLHKEAAEQAIRRAQQVENYQKVAEIATLGMYDMSLDGRLLGANNVFFHMCGLEKVDDLDENVVTPFKSCVVDEDQSVLRSTLDKLVTEGTTQRAEIRFNAPWIEKDSEGNDIVAPRWIHATFMPVKDSEGVIKSFTGCLSDVSKKNWQFANERQRFETERERYEAEKERKNEAIEAKRQQENFIDMTSHEMRNPLSAIVQCADAIIASLSKAIELGKDVTKNAPTAGPSSPEPVNGSAELSCYRSVNLVQNAIDNAETIIACTQHQRRIVDDILTMSKMDSNLLSVTPTTVDPVQIAREAFKMFEVEARRVDIKLEMNVDLSFKNMDIEFLDLDPSRLKQVLINLLTNALKFTKNQDVREVTIGMTAVTERPTDETSAVQFIPRAADVSVPDRPLDKAPVTADTPVADSVFLMFDVKDTGQGLSEEEKASLFQRFVQASPKTHVKYGGSGLGLFISKRLTEMQGGAIGVASHPGQGSTFAFYIEARVPDEPARQEARAAAEALDQALQSPSGSSAKVSAKGVTYGQPAKPWADIKVDGVLVVEDNLINQQITRRGLHDRGHQVDVANHGLEALSKLEHTNRGGGDFPLTLITMDMEMPIQDGLTCTREIREMERAGKIKGPRIPILAVSANARLEQIAEAMAAGCDEVLVKPYRISDLTEKMKTAVYKSQQKEEEKKEAKETTADDEEVVNKAAEGQTE